VHTTLQYLIFVLFSFFTVFYKLFIYVSFPNIAQLTDFLNYDAIFRGHTEDTGFYPVFISIKNIFVYFSIPYPVFQITVSSLYTISVCTFLLSSMESLKLKSKSIVMTSALIAIAYSLLSYSSFKSFSLVKFYLSISILGFSCCIIRPNNISLTSPSLFNLAGALFTSPQTLPALLLYSNDRIRQHRSSISNVLKKLRIRLSLSPKKLLQLMLLVLSLLTVWFLVSLSTLLADGSSDIASILFTSLTHKFSTYLSPDLLGLLLFFCLLCPVLIFFTFCWRGLSYLALSLAALLIVVLFGLNRFSPLIPFFLFSFFSQRPLICICLIDMFLSYEIIKGIGLLV
jgi:hypothetical protein